MAKFKLILTAGFKKDLKRLSKRKLDISKLETVVDILLSGEQLPPKYKDHNLIGNWFGHRECHIDTDWLLIYYIENDVLTLTLTRTGSHSDMF